MSVEPRLDVKSGHTSRSPGPKARWGVGGGDLAVKENLGHVFSLQDLSNIDALLRESRERGLNCISDF